MALSPKERNQVLLKYFFALGCLMTLGWIALNIPFPFHW
jgi:hypothetical protein